MRAVRAVLFDLDDTLFDHQRCSRAALADVRDGQPCFAAVEAADFEASHARILEELHLEVMSGRIELDTARVERFRRLYAWAGVDVAPELAARAAAMYRARYLAARVAVGGAAVLLAAIRSSARIVIVSNNLLEEQRDKLRHCGLERYVDALVVSQEAGVSKPDPAIFHLALQRVDAAPDEAVMIGDSWENDIQGARSAGIRAIWFNRNGERSPDPAVATIHSLEPAEDVLRVVLNVPGTEARRGRASAHPR